MTTSLDESGTISLDVSQDSRLGRLGLKALWNRGICGPPYDLSDLDVHIYPPKNSGDTVDVFFYDMSACVGPKDKLYQSFIDALKELREAA